jgi:hypothetical protein
MFFAFPSIYPTQPIPTPTHPFLSPLTTSSNTLIILYYTKKMQGKQHANPTYITNPMPCMHANTYEKNNDDRNKFTTTPIVPCCATLRKKK